MGPLFLGVAGVKPECIGPIYGIHIKRDTKFAIVGTTGVVVGGLIDVMTRVGKKGLELPPFFFVLEILVHELSKVRITTGETACGGLSRFARAVGEPFGTAPSRVGKVSERSGFTLLSTIDGWECEVKFCFPKFILDPWHESSRQCLALYWEQVPRTDHADHRQILDFHPSFR